MKRITEAVFTPVLDYGIVIKRHAASSILKTMNSVYHSVLCFIISDAYVSHPCILYSNNWVVIHYRRDMLGIII